MKGDLTIQFTGLKDGFHEFHFEVGNKFFEQFDYSEIKKSELTVDVRFEKRVTMLILNFEISGSVEVMCDKCTDDFFLRVDSKDELIYKFGEGVSIDEKIIILSEKEIELDLSQPIYEFTLIAIPSRRIHQEGKCNQEMLNAMDDYLIVESDEVETSDDEITDKEEIDPRWSELNKLKK